MTALVAKACPIVLRGSPASPQILTFVHPRAGLQIVKVTIATGENTAVAALRELEEEAGISAATIILSLGSHDDIQPGERWHLFIVSAADQPETWDHAAVDDDGDTYRFFWHPLSDGETGGFDPRFLRAMDKVRAAIASRQIPQASFG
jgi:8-oxo-dGTP pyrophosphatase MutT (NUDIX family)